MHAQERLRAVPGVIDGDTLTHLLGMSPQTRRSISSLVPCIALIFGCADDSPAMTATAASAGCDANVDAAVCLAADQLKACVQGSWQYLDCEAACEHAGLSALGCGADPVGGAPSCLCGGGAGTPGMGTGESSGSAASESAGPACVSYGASCQTDEDCCASEVGEAVCATSSMGRFCVQTCAQDQDCPSQCCVAHPSGAHACAHVSECGGPCSSDYGPCGADSDCCGFESGAAYCLDHGDGGHCRPTCHQDSDCSQGCCHSLDKGDRVCAAPHYCADDNPFLCNNPGQSCSAHEDCCDHEREGSQCVNFGGGNVLCAQTCILDSQCLSGCCVPTEDGPKVCVSAVFCEGG